MRLLEPGVNPNYMHRKPIKVLRRLHERKLYSWLGLKGPETGYNKRRALSFQISMMVKQNHSYSAANLNYILLFLFLFLFLINFIMVLYTFKLIDPLHLGLFRGPITWFQSYSSQELEVIPLPSSIQCCTQEVCSYSSILFSIKKIITL